MIYKSTEINSGDDVITVAELLDYFKDSIDYKDIAAAFKKIDSAFKAMSEIKDFYSKEEIESLFTETIKILKGKIAVLPEQSKKELESAVKKLKGDIDKRFEKLESKPEPKPSITNIINQVEEKRLLRIEKQQKAFASALNDLIEDAERELKELQNKLLLELSNRIGESNKKVTIVGGINIGERLKSLTDVKFTNLQDNDIIQYNSVTGKWENVTPGSIESVTWGEITGTLSNQTDLQAALDTKANLSGGNTFSGDQFFADSEFFIRDNGDTTKRFQFQASGISAAATRTYTVPNQDGTLALVSDLTAYQPLDADLTAIAALTGTGFAVRTATDTWAQRTQTGTANEITVTNGTGVSGNPVYSLPTALTFTGKTVTGGTFSGIIISGSTTLSGFTQNSVLFVGSAGVLTQDNTNFTYTDSTNTLNVGGNVEVVGSLFTKTAVVLEETGVGTDIITIQAPSSIAANYTLTLPVDDGTPGQVWATDGTGTLSWVNAGAIPTGFTQGSVIFQGASTLAQDNANFFWDDTNNRLGILTAAPAGALTVQSGSLTARFGADVNAVTLTDATRKYMRFGMPHYSTAATDIALVNGDSDGTNNYLNLGGGVASLNTTTGIRFWSAATTTTAAGTEIGRITITGLGLFVTAPAAALDIFGGTAAQLRLTSSITNSANKTGYLQVRHYTNAEEDFGLLSGQSTTSDNIVFLGGGATASLNAATQIRFYTAATNTTTTGTEIARINTSGLGIFATPSASALTVQSGNISALLGADMNAFTLTDATRKFMRLAMPHYTNAEEPAALIIGDCDPASNYVNIGGGSSTVNAATYIRMFTAANNTTVTGTEILRGQISGIGIYTTDPDAYLTITAADISTNQIRLRSARVAIANTNVIGGVDFMSADTNITAPGTLCAQVQALAEGTHTATSLATGIVFFTTASASAVMAEAGRFNASAQLVLGIGSVTLPSYTFSGDTNTGMYSPSAEQICFATNGTEGVRINNGQNVGIGTGATISARIHAIATTTQLRLGYDASNYLGFTTASTGETTIDAVGADAGVVFNDNVGFSAPSPATKVDIIGGTAAQFRISSSSTNSTSKTGYMQCRHYLTAEEDFGFLVVQSNSTDNIIFLGGGNASINSATEVRFYTSATSTTVTGTLRGLFDPSGNFGVGTSTTVSARVHSISTTEQLRAGFDASNYFSLNVDAGGFASLNTTGTAPGFTFLDNVGFGAFTSTPVSRVDIFGTAGVQLCLGNAITNASNKTATIHCRHYLSAEPGATMILGTSTAASNVVYIGGGSSTLDAATEIRFFTAADTTTATGTLRGILDLSGNFGFGATSGLVARTTVLADSTGDEVFRISTTATNDDVIASYHQSRIATTDGTASTLYTHTIPASTTVRVEATVVARRTGGSAGTAEDGASYKLSGCYKNVAGTATIIGVVTTIYADEDQAGWNATLQVNAGTVRVRVTGATNNNVTWHLSEFKAMPIST